VDRILTGEQDWAISCPYWQTASVPHGKVSYTVDTLKITVALDICNITGSAVPVKHESQAENARKISVFKYGGLQETYM